MPRIGPRRLSERGLLRDSTPGRRNARSLDTPSIVGPMLESLMKSVFGSKHERDRRRTLPIVDEINRFYESFRDLPDDQLCAKTAEFKARLAEALKDVSDPEEHKRVERETLDDLL